MKKQQFIAVYPRKIKTSYVRPMIRAAFRIRKQCWCSMQKNRGGKFIRFTVMMIILVQTGGGRSLSGC